MFKIGDFSKLAQVSVKTLRYYDQLGLLKPAWIDRFTGYRYYTADQLPCLNRVLALKELGFSLEQIQRLLSEELSAAELRGMMRMKRAEVEQHIQSEQARLMRIADRVRQIEQEGDLPSYEIVLKRISPQQVAGLRKTIASPRRLEQLFAELLGYLRTQHPSLESAGAPLAVYYDVEFRDDHIDVEAAIPLVRPISAKTPLTIHQLPGAECMACAVHIGSPQELSEAYKALLHWIEYNGYRAAGPNRETYLQVPDANAAHSVIEVQFPVQKKPPLSFSLPNQEKQTMQPQIVNKPAFTAVGLLYHGKNENNEIAQLWDHFGPRIPEIKGITDGAFGLCGNTQEDGCFDYMAGFAVSDTENTPQGMTTWQVPAQKYAVFPCTLKNIHETYQYAFETWLPTSDYQYNKGVDFEYYDETFDIQDKDNAVLYIYIPIE